MSTEYWALKELIRPWFAEWTGRGTGSEETREELR